MPLTAAYSAVDSCILALLAAAVLAGVIKPARNITPAQTKIMKKKLNQKLKYRPNPDDLVKGGILRPGAKGRAYGSRAV